MNVLVKIILWPGRMLSVCQSITIYICINVCMPNRCVNCYEQSENGEKRPFEICQSPNDNSKLGQQKVVAMCFVINNLEERIHN